MQQLGADAVLLDADAGSYFELNASGVLVLQALLAGGELDVAVRSLCERFEVEPSLAQADCELLLQQLQAVGLIEAG